MKTINELRLGDSVWINGVEQYFAGFIDVKSKIVIADCLFNVVNVGLSINDKRLSLTKPPPKLKVGQPVWVRDSGMDRWMPRYFIAFDRGKCGASSRLDSWAGPVDERKYWDSWKLPSSVELYHANIDPDAWETSD